MTRTAKIGIVGVFSVVLTTIGSIAQQDQSTSPSNSVYVELAKAPKKAAALPNPLATDPEAQAAGAKLFAQHCAECHGEMAEGGRKAPTLLAEQVQRATPGSLFWILMGVNPRRNRFSENFSAVVDVKGKRYS
jgi:mono/diheme cytochrome c family protein